MEDEWSIFLGFGSCNDLRDAEHGPEPRLWGMRSVSKAAAIALHREPKPRKSRRIGFHRPR